MKKICIGIHVHAEPERLHATLASLRAHTERSHALLLVPDGPDTVTQAALAVLREVPQSGTPEPRGAAACFNRLVTSRDADVFVLLESGSLVGPGWLEHLLAALDADPRYGLAGPSTNSAWNEQGVFPHGGGTPAAVTDTAREAVRRFGQTWQTLEPLYSLADFCYAVRREVVEAIGAADEGYGLGPCWEMDYSIRAARAGWHGVWACAAYVYRAPFTSRRRREELLRLETSKHRYQDKFCGGRLRGEKPDYRTHCRGDACPNFAPPALIAVRQPLPEPPPNMTPQPVPEQPEMTECLRDAPTDRPGRAEPPGQGCDRLEVSPLQEPLVTCIMPTWNRWSFVPQALRCFLRQDYPNLELLIVDDGTEPIGDCVPDHACLRYVRLDRKMTIGAKRNFACSRARGDIVVHWDDDDWYPPWRVRVQVRALLERSADLCGSSRLFYYEASSGLAWEYRYAAPGRAWVAGNTLAYCKRFWERHPFPDVQVGEDSRFVWSNGDGNQTIADLAEPTLCVAAVHAGNTSRKETNGAFWHPRANSQVRALMGDDLYFYRPVIPPSDAAAAWPLVSCIMPTYNRRSFVPLALRYFRSQDYPNKELVIVDDGEDAVEDLVQNASSVRYIRLPRHTSIGAKRNLACQHAQGEVVAHWDDDDWYAPDRLRYQVTPLLADKADITGLENAFVLELPGGVFWTTQPRLHQRMFVGNVHGGTLVYRKTLLAHGLRYPEVNLAEDAWLLHRAVQSGKRLLRLANPGVFVYMRHGNNAWRECIPGRFLDPAGWQRCAPPPVFSGSVLTCYQQAAGVIGGQSE